MYKLTSKVVDSSLQDIILPHAKKQIDESSSPEKRDLILKCRTIEDKIDMLNKQLEASDKLKSEYQQHYEYAIDDLKKLSDHYKSRINSLENKCSLFDERCSSLMETIDSAKQESLEWKRKFEELITSRNNENISASEEISVFKSWNHAAKAEATANEAARSALKEANEWKIKYENAVRETKAAVEKVASVQESAKQAQFREDALRADFSRSLEEKVLKLYSLVLFFFALHIWIFITCIILACFTILMLEKVVLRLSLIINTPGCRNQR